MDTQVQTPDTGEVSNVETAAKTKRQIKAPGAKSTASKVVKPKPVKAEAPKEPAAPKVNPHIEAGIDLNLYSGLSKYVNANRKVAVRQDVVATVNDMTDRMQKGLYALRRAYGSKQWVAKGFDNGILAHLAAAGLIELTGGHVQVIDGHPKLTDGTEPVRGKITAAGMKYGVA